MYFCFDTETGGLDPKTTSLLSLAANLVHQGKPVYNTCQEWLVRPTNGIYQVTASALLVNGINILAHDTNALDYEDVDQYICEFIEGGLARCGVSTGEKVIPVGWNVSFDISFIRENLPQTFRKFQYRVLDVQCLWMLYCEMIGLSGINSLSQAYSFCYPNDNRVKNAHNATTDVEMTIGIYQKLKTILTPLIFDKD